MVKTVFSGAAIGGAYFGLYLLLFIVASFGTFSTGVNIKRLHNIIFSSPSKSRIRVLQSIGRGLRKGDKKIKCNLFDVGDDLSWKSKKNYTLTHMIERIKLYNEEQFEYKIYNINLVKNLKKPDLSSMMDKASIASALNFFQTKIKVIQKIQGFFFILLGLGLLINLWI